MHSRSIVADADGSTRVLTDPPSSVPDHGWLWIDVTTDAEDADRLLSITAAFGLDRLAVRDAVVDVDVPKVDDFGDHLLFVLHGLRADRVATYEVDCFLADRLLVTVHGTDSPAVDVVVEQLVSRTDLAARGVDEVVALLADALTRRLLSVLEAFDERVEDLTLRALQAHPDLLEDLTAVRTDLAAVRRVVHPQREALDIARHITSPLVSDAGRRRFSDVFDVASRAAGGLDEARAALAETLDAYRGAEARQATEVTKVLTVYAAIMLPLSLVVGFFGMNFDNLPWLRREHGWMIVTGVMAVISLVSLGMFISLGWVRRPSGRRTGETLGRGLLEATRAPVHLVGAVLEVSTMPIRATSAALGRTVGRVEREVESRVSSNRGAPVDGPDHPAADDEASWQVEDDPEHHGSE